MHDDLHLPITLTIADYQATLHVIGFSGRDALNEPYRFEIDVLCADQQLESSSLLQTDAYLAFSDTGGGAHGHIAQVCRLHHGTSVNLYRLTLVPALQALANHSGPRCFNGMTTVQIILHLLHEHGLGGDAVRFQCVTGVYPVREHCVKLEETDLHLLQRLCEEEGIHYRFEHHPERHVLIFSDDPSDFAQMPTAVTVRPQLSTADGQHAQGLDRLAECLSVGTSYSTHLGQGPGDLAPAWMFGAAIGDEHADNQALSEDVTAGCADGETALTPRRRQAGVRRLERLRCERRQVMGLGNQPQLHSGQVMRVIGHEASLFNDQWLLVEVHHSGKQLQLLQGLADAKSIVRALAHPRSVAFANLPAGYRNTLRVIPWAMPFRAALSHPRPSIDGAQRARLISLNPDAQGRLRIRYDWQKPDSQQSGEDSWAKLSRSVLLTEAGSMLDVRFLDGDANKPYICGVELTPPALSPIPASAVDGLSLRSRKALALRTAVAQLEIDAGRIRVKHSGDTAVGTITCPRI